MGASFERIATRESLHERVTRSLALRIIQEERARGQVAFPNEADLCEQLGVSRSILREAVKVLTDKGLLEVKPRSGTRSRPRNQWNLLDPDLLAWQAQVEPDCRFLRDLCEVRLAIEPTASGFAAIRATVEELAFIGECLERREAARDPEETVPLDLGFYTAVVEASHNPLFCKLNAIIREPLRTALSQTVRLRASEALLRDGNRALLEAIRRREPLGARVASEQIVGLAMLAVEQVIRWQERQR